MISSCGHSIETDAEYQWNGLARGSKNFAVFQLTLSGEGRLEFEENAYTLTARDAFLVPIPYNHKYYLPDESKKWEFVYVVVYGAEIIRLVKSLVKRRGPVMRLGLSSSVYAILNEILSLTGTATPFKVSGLAYKLLMTLLEEAALPCDAVRDKSRLFVEQAKLMIGERLEEHLDVGDVASSVGLSRHHFSRLFKRLEGVSPHDYIEHLRFKKAVDMLYNEKLAVKEIAFSCGYRDVNYFCRTFKRATGVSPGTYRRTGI